MIPAIFAVLGCHFSLMLVLFALAGRYGDEDIPRCNSDVQTTASPEHRFSRVLVPVMIGCAALGVAGIWIPLLSSVEAFVMMAMIRIAALAFYAAR